MILTTLIDTDKIFMSHHSDVIVSYTYVLISSSMCSARSDTSVDLSSNNELVDYSSPPPGSPSSPSRVPKLNLSPESRMPGQVRWNTFLVSFCAAFTLICSLALHPPHWYSPCLCLSLLLLLQCCCTIARSSCTQEVLLRCRS